MRPIPAKTRPLGEALRSVGAKLEGWQVRALFLGAQSSTSLRVGPQHLLPRICGGEPVLGRDLDEANANLHSLMALWNELVEEQGRGRVKLSAVRIGRPPKARELEALITRRSEEITWFLRGIDAGGDHPMEFGAEGEALFRRLAEGAAFLESFRKLLTRTPESELGEARETLEKLTGTIELIIRDIGTVGASVRKKAIDESRRMAGKRSDDGATVQRPIKVGRNEPCPCGSGRKWKRCCGAPQPLQ